MNSRLFRTVLFVTSLLFCLGPVSCLNNEADDLRNGTLVGLPDFSPTSPRSSIRMDGKSCYTAEGSLGTCTTFRSCYSTLKSVQSSLEIWTAITRGTCPDPGEHGSQQVYDICCSRQQQGLINNQVVNLFTREINPATAAAMFDLLTALMPYYYQREKDRYQDLYNSYGLTADSGISFDEDDQLMKQQTVFPCGRGPNSERIVGGTEARKNSWPFVVAIRFDGFVFCGGSLISPNKILTAAHCVERNSISQISQMTVSLGMHTVGDGKSTLNDAQVTRRISRIAVHSGFNRETMVNDIAVLTLDSPVAYSKAVSPVCLPLSSDDADQYAGQDAVLMGWGKLKFDGFQSDTLQQARGRILTSYICWTNYHSSFVSSMLCTTAPVQSACTGDGGGPVVVLSSSGSWTIVGINSFSKRCGPEPGVKTRVAAFRAWIDRHIN